MRRAFTLMEMLISIVILSLMMLFLYKSYALLNRSNKNFEKKTEQLRQTQRVKEILLLDLSLKLTAQHFIVNQNKKEDIFFFQTSHSLHQRYNPYVAYIPKNGKLYRLESLHPLQEYPLDNTLFYTVDELAEVKNFRVYQSTSEQSNLFLVHCELTHDEPILLKVKPLSD